MSNQKLEIKINVITAILMSGFMAFVLSGVFTLLNIGFGLEWVFAWAKGFALAWPLALILALITGKTIRNIAETLAQK